MILPKTDGQLNERSDPLYCPKPMAGSTANPQLPGKDFPDRSDNILLHRMPVRRLQAEAIRDSLLAVSGRSTCMHLVQGPHTPDCVYDRPRSRPSGPWMGMAEEVFTRQSTGISSILFFWPSICPVLSAQGKKGKFKCSGSVSYFDE